MKYTLAEWQLLEKPQKEFIIQASSMDGKDTMQPFPIGMSYRWQSIALGTHTDLLLTAINPTSDKARRGAMPIHRQTILKSLATKGFYNNFMTPKEFFRVLPNYKFVTSPEGNGIDCHRHYESIVAGCIPIIEDHPDIRKKYEGLPILYTKDYKEINRTYLLNTYKQMVNQHYDFSRLFLSFYTDKEQEEIKRCSEYWISKLSPTKPF